MVHDVTVMIIISESHLYRVLIPKPGWRMNGHHNQLRQDWHCPIPVGSPVGNGAARHTLLMLPLLFS